MTKLFLAGLVVLIGSAPAFAFAKTYRIACRIAEASRTDPLHT